MAGGKGTRLRPFTAILPKPLVPIGDISILEMVLRQLKYYGFTRVVVAVGHKAELIMAVIGDGNKFGLQVTYHLESQPLGTMGALASIDSLEENFLVMNGDICTNLNFRDFYRDHTRCRAMATVATYARREKIELGVLTLNPDGGKIIGFREKPTYDFLVSMGVNAFHRSVLDLIPKNTFFGFDDLMLKMLAEKIEIRPYLFNGHWHDVGRPDDYDKMLADFEKNPAVYLPDWPTPNC